MCEMWTYHQYVNTLFSANVADEGGRHLQREHITDFTFHRTTQHRNKTISLSSVATMVQFK